MVGGRTDTAVAIFTIVRREGTPPHVLLVSQFRPPVGNNIIELPAGLVDEGEEGEGGAKRAALRELAEETGYGGEDKDATTHVKDVSGILYNDPGMTGANMRLCTVEIQLAKDAPEPVANPDEGEFIERHLVPLYELRSELARMCLRLTQACNPMATKSMRALNTLRPASPWACRCLVRSSISANQNVRILSRAWLLTRHLVREARVWSTLPG